MNTHNNDNAASSSAASLTIGLDLSDRKVAICILGTEGQVLQELSQPNSGTSSLRRVSSTLAG